MGRLFESPVHLLILLLVIVVLFGAKRLPDAARGLGRSMRILKSEVKDMKEEEATRAAGATGAVEGRVLPSTPAPEAPAVPEPAPSDQRRDL
ncbi:MAG: Sec-independent protein translocase subunit TatA [Kineosporiaceae bacterium]|jgi:sec-independent protein translocase protein TatA